ncbi:mechanosensitive ion channel domain-containing protein [Nodularia harveyana UHCC-0300]|uniref:Mechanosensitive ion channel domain-containing protein n=1 Tax=Nodularia harveyana UHCC-0300 TaxID=2974287 RepID=A0ABU5UCQ8_9CYAN|nr:mechanosensitive ion channel domain-containing protein [Nodularia harveyana]MEA5581336.1 mechanosensitive ion channel domain-containing protein [Nodularia harveyana UHCC-0300]
MRYRVRAIVAGVVCVFALWGTPGRTQEQPVEESTAEQAQPAASGDPRFAITTQDPTVPIDELQLLVKPLTLEELQNESAAWLLLLKDKVQNISNAEIAIKRQNQSINKQKEASDALSDSQEALKAAEEQLKTATPGSPEYEEATKKLEAAKEDLKKGQESIQEAQEAKQNIQQDDTLTEAIENAKGTEELDKAKAALDEAKKQREQFIAGSLAYDNATQQIEQLDAAIKAFEAAQIEQKESVPDSPEFQAATVKLDAAQKSLKEIRESIEGITTPDPTQQSSQDLNNTATALDNTEISGDGSTKVAGAIETVNDTESLKTKGDKLEKAAEQLDENADTEAKLKNQLVANVTELQSDRTAIVDRFKVVLAELERKGGDPQAYQKYIEAISIVTVDLQDTEGALVRLVSWVKSGEGGLRWAANIGKFVSIVIASVIVSQLLGMILNRSLKQIGGASELLRQFIVMVVKRGGVVVGVMLALTALEVSLGPILALVGGASFVLAFALQSNLGNFASGLMIMFNKPFDIGDEVKVGGIWGYVDSISLANTNIKGFAGQMYVIPNNNVWGGMIENLTPDEIRKISIWLRISFNEDLERVQNLMVDIMKSHPKVLENPGPGKFLWSVEEYYFSIGLSGWTKTDDFWGVHEDIIQMIQERFKEENIQMSAIPERNLHLLQNTTQTPEPVAEKTTRSLSAQR